MPITSATRQIDLLLKEVLVTSNLLRRHGLADVQGNLAPCGQDIVVLLASDGPLTVPQIARKRSNSRQNIQIIVNRLLGTGLAQLNPNPDHKRSPLVSLTPKAGTLMRDLFAAKATRLDSIASSIPAEHVELVMQVLRVLRESLQPVHRPDRRNVQRHPAPGSGWQQGAIEDELPVSLL